MSGKDAVPQYTMNPREHHPWFDPFEVDGRKMR